MVGALLLAAALSPASATPYFRIMDPSHPQTSIGALVDVADAKQSAVNMSIAVFTHSPKDGCALPSVVCESWTPLAVGFSANGGRYLLSFGPSANLAPLVRSMLLRALSASTGSDKYLGLKASLAQVESASDISVAFGPAWVVSPSESWKGYFRLFTGAAWRF